MSRNILRRIGVIEDLGEYSEDIESCDDDDVGSHNRSADLDNTIEECEEPRHLGRYSSSTRKTYPPLDVRRKRENTVSSVNSQRTINIERKTVLYGQTPKAIRQQQFLAIAELSGLTTKELAKRILSANLTTDNLSLLRQFHTQQEPGLSILFDDLENCNFSAPEVLGKVSVHRLENTSKTPPKRKVGVNRKSHQEPMLPVSCVNERIVDSESRDLFNNLASEEENAYFCMPTVPAHDLTATSFVTKRQSSTKRLKSSDEVGNGNTQKTVVSETDSDSSDDLSSRNVGNYNHRETRHNDCGSPDLMVENESSSSLRNLHLSSLSSNVFDPLIGTINNNSLQKADNSQHSNLETNDHNSFLDGLLFDEAPSGSNAKSLHASIRIEVNSEFDRRQSCSVIGNDQTIRETNTSQSSEESRINNNCNSSTSGLVRRNSNGYNRVLDNLLFKDSHADSSSLSITENSLGSKTPKYPERHFQTRENQTPTNGSSVHHTHNNQRTKQSDLPHCCLIQRNANSTDRSILIDIADSSESFSGESSKENCSPKSTRKHDNLEGKEILHSVGNNEENVPTSQEFRSSLWQTLDGSLEN